MTDLVDAVARDLADERAELGARIRAFHAAVDAWRRALRVSRITSFALIAVSCANLVLRLQVRGAAAALGVALVLVGGIVVAAVCTWRAHVAYRAMRQAHDRMMRHPLAAEEHVRGA